MRFLYLIAYKKKKKKNGVFIKSGGSSNGGFVDIRVSRSPERKFRLSREKCMFLFSQWSTGQDAVIFHCPGELVCNRP